MNNNTKNIVGLLLLNPETLQLFTTNCEVITLNYEEYNIKQIQKYYINNLELLKTTQFIGIDLDIYKIKKEKISNIFLCAKDDYITFLTKEFKNNYTFDELKQILCEYSFNTFENLCEGKEAKKTLVNESQYLLIGVMDNMFIPFVDQLEHFVNENQPKKGLKKFIQKFNKVAKKCSHTAEQLISFMEKSELPLTDSGDILGYKALFKQCDKYAKDYYVDTHTNKVIQDVGMIIQMDRANVTDDPSVSCSQGLHIASLGYLGNFITRKQDIFLVKVNPKNVVSVPINEEQKMRCSRYTILAKLPESVRKFVENNQPIDDEETHKILNKAIKGELPLPTRFKKIDHNGNTLEEGKYEIPQQNIQKHSENNGKSYSLKMKSNVTSKIADYSHIKKTYKGNNNNV